jgi:hypothetical protein
MAAASMSVSLRTQVRRFSEPVGTLELVCPTGAAHSVNDGLRGSFIAMVKSTDLWNLNDPFRSVRLHCTRLRSVLIQ